MKRPWFIVATVALAAGCGDSEVASESTSTTGGVESAWCEALSTERALPLPPPATATAPTSLAAALHQLLSGSLAGERAGVSAFIEPTAASDLSAVANLIREIPGTSVVQILDQDAYEEFARLFPDNPLLVESVTPDVMPPTVRAEVDDDVALEALRTALSPEPAVRDVLDDRLT